MASNSRNVKLQALNVINNLAMDMENQRFLKVCTSDTKEEYRSPFLVLLASLSTRTGNGDLYPSLICYSIGEI